MALGVGRSYDAAMDRDSEPPPCLKCSMVQMCEEGLCCKEFAEFVRTGKSVVPRIPVPSRKRYRKLFPDG